jgi:RNA polymerase sigma-70 factor (ECF subfamily)
MFAWIARLPRQQCDESSWIELQLLQGHRTAVVHFLYRMVENRAVAEKLAAEAFVRLYRSRASFDTAPQSATRLFSIAADLALSELRNGTSQSIPDLTVRARWALTFLPDKQRAALLLHKYHRMDYRQIAKVLHCRESAARSLLLSAYETLRRQLAASDRELTGFSGEPAGFQNGFDPLQQIG